MLFERDIMSERFLLGLDNGGTLVKAGLYNVKGGAAAFASAEIPAILGKDGIVERDMEVLWEVNCRVIRDVIAKAKINPLDIKGVSVSGHGNGLYLVDDDLKPVMNGIYSTDTRAKGYVERFNKTGICDSIFPKTMQTLYPGQFPPLLVWLSDNRPDILKRAKWALGCIDYIRLCLTGEVFGEITNMSAASVMDQNTRKYDDGILEAMGIAHYKRLLPPLAQSCGVCGRVSVKASRQTGLSEGTPVAGGLIDLTACAIASGLADTKRLCMIAGTWSINEFIWKKPLVSKGLLLTSVYCIDGYYLITDGSMTSASNLEWFLHEFFKIEKRNMEEQGKDVYSAASAMVEAVKPEDSDVIFLPFLYGTNVDADARSCFLGLSGWHRKAHMLRAVYEGIVFSHRMHIEKLLALRNNPPETIRMAGGVTKSSVWVQMFADALQIPIEISDSSELGTLGVAMCAGVAVGEYASLYEASGIFSKTSYVFKPDKAKKDIYNRKYKLYKKAIECLEPAWKSWDSKQ